MITLLRAFAGLILGLVIFAGLMYSLVLVNFLQRLEDPEVYKTAINDTDAYNRIYDEVLLDDALADQTSDLLGGVEAETQEEIVDVLREVMPPSYLREQTENNIDRFTGYLVGDYEELNIYVDLEEPLNRVELSVVNRVDQIIDELEIVEASPASSAGSTSSPGGAGSGECPEDTLALLAEQYSEPLAQISDGEIPDSIPSLDILTPECRASLYDEWYERILNDPAINSETARILEDEKESLRRSFVKGDTRELLKEAAGPLVEPVIEDAVRDVRRDLSRGDRLDLLQELAEISDEFSKDDVQDQAESLKEGMGAATGPARIIALVMVILGALLLAAVHFPKPADMLRWPGITLLLGGGVCLAVGIVVNSAVPGRIKDAIVNSTSYAPDVPTAAISLAGDMAESFAQQVSAGFVPAAVTVLVVGALLVVGSFFAEALWAILRRILPGSDGNGGGR